MKNMQKFFNNKEVLVTGQTGFKGAWLSQILSNWGAKVTGIALPPATRPNLFNVLKLKNKTSNYFLDIRDFKKLKTVLNYEKPEILFHLAAQAIVRDSYDDPLKTISTNTLGTANIMQAIKETDCIKAAVIITSDKVYLNTESIYPYRETDTLGGHDPYSASKAAADKIVQSYIKSFLNPESFGKTHQTLVAITRAGNVIGGGDWAKFRIVPDIIRAIYEENQGVIIRNPQAIRPWVHVLEPLSGYLTLAQRLYDGEGEFVGAWNFGPDHESFICVDELIKKAIGILEKGDYKIQPDNSKYESTLLKLDTSKAKSLLGWKPKLSIDDALSFTFDWYKNYYEKINPVDELTNQQIEEFFNI